MHASERDVGRRSSDQNVIVEFQPFARTTAPYRLRGCNHSRLSHSTSVNYWKGIEITTLSRLLFCFRFISGFIYKYLKPIGRGLQ